MLRKIPILSVAAVLMVVAGFMAAPSLGNNGKPSRQGDPWCTISPNPVSLGQSYTVSANGLPTGTAINLWVTDPSGKTVGSALGSTASGSFALAESSSSAGTWTYAFSGPTKQNMTVYASCSVAAS